MLIVCDESTQGNCSVLGGVSISKDEAIEFERKCFIMRFDSMVFGELCWKSITSKGKYLDFYLDLIRTFFSFPTARYHSNSYTGNQYRVGYSLIRSISWKLENCRLYPELNILFDETGKIGKEETEITRHKLNEAYNHIGKGRVYHKIRMCNQTDSNVINLCQIADLLTGAVAYKIAIKEGSIDKNSVNDYFISEIEKIDDKQDISFSFTGKLWNYNEKKIQHYNLHSVNN